MLNITLNVRNNDVIVRLIVSNEIIIRANTAHRLVIGMTNYTR